MTTTERVVSCSHGHRLVRWEPEPCDAGHDHRLYICPMRLGSRRCGEEQIVPPPSPACVRKSE